MSESSVQIEQNISPSPAANETASATSENESEYESVDEVADNANRRKSIESEPREEDDSRDSSGDEKNISLRREEGDGQESAPSKKVDDDEDKKNPQYIPKRGTFYEHDDRTADDVEEAVEPEKEKDGKKRVWQDKKERWTHDKYNDNEQAPKSKAELIQIYGYDIRNEDGPPKARRRRRYGRGPNKYTRNWEDEDAYSKPAPIRPKKNVRKPRDGEDFPPLRTEDKKPIGENRTEETDENNRVASFNQNNRTAPKPPPQEPHATPQDHDRPQPEQNNKNRAGSGRVPKPPQKEIQDSDYRGFARPRNYKVAKSEQKVMPRKHKVNADAAGGSEVILSQNFTNQSHYQELEHEMGKMNLVEVGQKGKFGGGRQGSVPPRMQPEQKASKRYSSLRQRSLPETANPPFNQNFYQNEYPQQVPSQQAAATAVLPATTQVPQIAPPPIPPIPQQVTPVTATQILQAPPPFATPFPQAPPAFLQASAVPAPSFIPQQTPQIINYVQSQPQFTQPAYQGFQQPFNPVQTQPAELYQPQGGITYYSAQEQQVAQRAAPLKRPKAAIPIVPPPPEPRGRGRNLGHVEMQAAPGVDGEGASSGEIATENAAGFEDAPEDYGNDG